jgi:DNA-binding NarL/FixJ family response regulator
MLRQAESSERTITVVATRFGPVFDRGLAALLDEEHNLRTLGCALDLGELEAAVARDAPNVAILGHRSLTSSSVLRRLKLVQPNIGLVVLAHELVERDAQQLFALGATACLTQEATWSDFVVAIRLAAEGKQIMVSAERPHKAFRRESSMLTQREWEVFQLLRAGRSNHQIADALHIGGETVRSHVQRIYRKLGVERRSELASSEF